MGGGCVQQELLPDRRSVGGSSSCFQFLSVPPTMASSSDPQSYRVKKVIHHERECRILLQSENGPCPLLAIANILLLSGKLSLSSRAISTGRCDFDEVVTALATKLLDCKAPSEAMQENHEQNVADAVDSLSHLQVGLDVNIKFTSATAIEYTKELVTFDLLGLQIMHGWLVDPQDTETAAAIGDKSYNALMEQLIEVATAVTPKRQEDVGLADDGAGESSAGEAAEGGAAGEAGAAAAQEGNFEEMQRTHSELLRRGKLVEAFFNATATQLTYHGITELHSQMRDGQYVCFFRNNHYSVLHKSKGCLWNLVTDEGYARERDIVWERLDEVEGDCDFYDGNLRKFVPHSSAPPPPPPVVGGGTVVQGVPVQGVPVPAGPAIDADLAYAQRLQQQEEQAYRAQQIQAQKAAAAKAERERRAHQQRVLMEKKKKEKEDSCMIM